MYIHIHMFIYHFVGNERQSSLHLRSARPGTILLLLIIIIITTIITMIIIIQITITIAREDGCSGELVEARVMLCVFMCMCLCMCIYIYIERERDR